MTDLKPCPFCGKEAVVRDFGLYEGMRDIRVGCVDAFLPRGDWGAPKSPCPVSPIAYNWSIGAETPEQMAEAWNARWERTCHMNCTSLYDEEGADGIECDECGWSELYDPGYPRPAHCPGCGAKVVIA